jgi:hypothetical protein
MMVSNEILDWSLIDYKSTVEAHCNYAVSLLQSVDSG